MKMVQHPNVVRLYEVIDTATKLYLILELGDGGDMYDCIMKHDGGLTEEVSATVGGRVAVSVQGFVLPAEVCLNQDVSRQLRERRSLKCHFNINYTAIDENH